jgi:hypothetical protein
MTTKYENPPADEAKQIEHIIELTRQQLLKRYPSPKPVLRGVHPKDHGCVLGSFQIDSFLKNELRVGVFSEPGAEFPCAIRFSNAATTVLPDDPVVNGKPTPGSRGMAIKLVNIDSPNPEGLIPTQDFLMVNHPVFAFANVADYEALSELILRNNEDATEFFTKPYKTDEATLKRIQRTGLIVTRIRGGNDKVPPFQPAPSHPAQNSYFSAAPFLFGEGRVMKYRVTPINEPITNPPMVVEPDYLRKALRLRLDPTRQGNQSIVFLFSVQVRNIDEINIDTEIEDASNEWDETKYPFESVGTITIPPQDFETDAARERCERIFLTPWHTHPEHRPLGGINRLRQKVYETSMKMRLGN